MTLNKTSASDKLAFHTTHVQFIHNRSHNSRSKVKIIAHVDWCY